MGYLYRLEGGLEEVGGGVASCMADPDSPGETVVTPPPDIVIILQ